MAFDFAVSQWLDILLGVTRLFLASFGTLEAVRAHGLTEAGFLGSQRGVVGLSYLAGEPC